MSNARNLARLLPNASGQLPDAAMASGSVLQVVSASSSTAVINNTTSFADTGLTVTITPSSASSKILVHGVVPFQIGSNGGNIQIQFNVVRGTTELTSNIAADNVSSIVQMSMIQTLLWLDSPATTSPTTYKIQFKEINQAVRYGNSAVMPVWNAAQTGVITVMEIAA